MHWVYVLLSYALFGLLAPMLALHRKTKSGWRQRLGFFRPGELPPRSASGKTVWLHGASAGDLLSLSPMIRHFRQAFPGCRIILSTITNTGYLMATERLAKDVDGVVYAPFDLYGATRRAVRAIAPDLLVLEYTELWPNLIHAAKSHGARIALTNGRVSPEHLSRYRALFALIGNPLRKIDLFLMREQDEADRILSLGASRKSVIVTGNTKFDALTSLSAADDDPHLREGLGLIRGKPVIIAGSTHEGEEEQLLRVYKRLLSEQAELKLIIAPRYIDRASRIRDLAKEAGFSVGLRSENNRSQGQVVVLDTIGELSRAYALATLVFVGGSFTSRGGQNILEPAAQGRPVLFGPHMENFHDSVQVLAGRGGIQVNDADHLYRVMSELLSRPDEVLSLGALARGTVRQISGASLRNVEQLKRVL
jgi:3-deoxy-D-manno-octulosonic-acid transferase